jgi:hypothetical protein
MPFISRRGSGRWVGFLLLAALAAVGCPGGGRGTITGKVKVNSVALKGGRVTYLAANGQSRIAEIEEDGSYTAVDVPAGPAKIGVETEYLLQQSKLPNYMPADAQGGPKLTNPEEAKRKYVKIPGTYTNPEESGLTWTVKRGNQEHDIELEDGSPGKQ